MHEPRLDSSLSVSLRTLARVGMSAALFAALSYLAVRPWLPQRPRPAIQHRRLPTTASTHPTPTRPTGLALAAPTSAPVLEPELQPQPSSDPEPPSLPGAASIGRPGEGGTIDSAVRLPDSDDYDIRCPYNAYAASYAAENLRLAISRLRAVYPGQLVIGDISRKYGGSFGSHRSHQSGRDVDIWLPIIGGLYRTDPECAMCGNAWCRAEPDEVDWRTTWTLIRTLEGTGAVERIFLDRSLHPRLRAAARALGESADAIDRALQPRPGVPALVMHSSGHIRHLHVRFACGPDEPSCED